MAAKEIDVYCYMNEMNNVCDEVKLSHDDATPENLREGKRVNIFQVHTIYFLFSRKKLWEK